MDLPSEPNLRANVLPWIREPLPRFQGYRYRPWGEIFDDFQGSPKMEEAQFLADRIRGSEATSLIDFGVGSGGSLAAILACMAKNSTLAHVGGIDIDGELIERASLIFASGEHNVSLHKADWFDLGGASPKLDRTFDFGLLTGNSLTHTSTGERESTIRKLTGLVAELRKIINPGGWLFIDARNFDYIRSIASKEPADRMADFGTISNAYYHGLGETRRSFPVYISDTLVVFHYYDCLEKTWSANDFFPIYQDDMLRILTPMFDIQSIFYDFSDERVPKSLFCQYLVRAKP